MTLHKIKLASIIVLLSISGCTEKDELTRPVSIHFKICFGLKEPQYVAFPYAEYFSFTQGQIGIQKIEFEGKREAGVDVYFETDPEINIPTIEFKGQFDPQQTIISTFSIPQGNYHSMKWDIYLKKIVTNKLIEGDDTDSLNTGLVIKGYFNKIWWNLEHYGVADSVSATPFLLTIDVAELFSCRSVNYDSNVGIVLSDRRDYEAILLLDLIYAFESISGELFDISGDILNQKIVVSSRENKDLYTIILHRITTSAKVLIK